MGVGVCVCVCMYVCGCVFVCMSVRLYIHIYIYTYVACYSIVSFFIYYFASFSVNDEAVYDMPVGARSPVMWAGHSEPIYADDPEVRIHLAIFSFFPFQFLSS